MSDIKILDACCGSRMFWFDKNERHTTFMDIRQETFEIHDKKVNVDPDVIGDFRDMPFENNTFNLVVFDPPHLKWAGKNSIMKAQYGQLDKVTWSEDLAKGFEECMRVLKVGGTLVFKWSDCQINVKKLLEVIPLKPLFGQQRGTTHWLTFVKFEEDIEYHTSLGVKKEKRKLAELQIFFEYIEANKQNLFDLCGLRGELS
ncbi:methyltransferase [Streptococcus phage 33888]|nr:methyltransferase [Streptococcus phage 33888]CIS16875.1 methyltransferase [Streptococcus pneumoniae]